MTLADPPQETDFDRENTMTPAPNGMSTGDTDSSSTPAAPASTQKLFPPGTVSDAINASPIHVESSSTQPDIPNGTNLEGTGSSATTAELSDAVSNGTG